jgi:4-amino-4-deoxy-L-arabinose transferase-like glycosyltransferase
MWRRPVDVAFGLAVAAATAWCLFLRTAEITSVPGINGDEAFTAAKALLWLRGEPMSLRTGSGLFPDPVSFGQLVGLHLLWSPSLWLIRAPAVLSGLASVAIAFYLGRRLWGTRTAIALAVLFACLPAHLAYARLGWEPADTPLAAVLVLTSALLWHWSATLALFVLALLVHPTNVFLGPIALAVQVRRGSPFQGRQLLEPRLLALYAGGAGLAAFFAIRRPAVVERAF